jgi:capsular exopolysaccharide synthesis family protein
VCLVDADFRRPVLHRVFDLRNEGGFASALARELPLTAVAARTAVPNLSVVVAGTDDGPPRADLLAASRLQRVLGDAARDWDLVIYDTPPVITVSDTIHLAAQCDGVILVVRAGAIPASVLRRAVRQIQQVRGRVLGVLLNRVDLKSGDDDSYGYYRAYYSGNSARR